MIKEQERQDRQLKVISKIWSLEEARFKVYITNEENKNKFLEENDEKYERDLQERMEKKKALEL